MRYSVLCDSQTHPIASDIKVYHSQVNHSYMYHLFFDLILNFLRNKQSNVHILAYC